jgi:F-type H+-transporting ATPase subunit b
MARLGLVLWVALLTAAWAVPALAQVGGPAHGAHGDDVHVAGTGAEAVHGDVDHHVPHAADINWMDGFIGEKEGVEPGLLWRRPGTPPPLGATLLNTAILVYLIVRFARRPLVEALKKRKRNIMTGMEEAGKMKDDAADRLQGYEDKLERMDEEIERVKSEMRATGEAERKRILADAKEKRERLEREARLLIEQELKVAREDLLRETVRAAVRSAEERLSKQLGPADQQRLADEYLTAVDEKNVNSPGGHA